tara:strand:+ start:168 stop:416 length:249 start_codon:yes stop_codon:yes gene_type:complete
MDIQYLGVYNNTAQVYQDASVLVRRTITDKVDDIEICTPFEPWKTDYGYGIKFFFGLDDRGIALEEDQVIEIIDAWKKNWNQ